MIRRAEGLRERSALTFAEVIVAGFVIAVALPPLIDAWVTISRMDRGQLGRGQAANLSQSVLEQIHYRMYNGSSQGDSRGGVKLNDPLDNRTAAFREEPPSYLKFFFGQKEQDLPLVPSGTAGMGGPDQSQFFTGFFGPQQGAAGAGGSDLAPALASFRCRVGVLAYLDVDPGDKDLAPKGTADPKVDMAQVAVTMTWKDGRGTDLKRSFVTRFSRHIYEVDVLASKAGR